MLPEADLIMAADFMAEGREASHPMPRPALTPERSVASIMGERREASLLAGSRASAGAFMEVVASTEVEASMAAEAVVAGNSDQLLQTRLRI